MDLIIELLVLVSLYSLYAKLILVKHLINKFVYKKDLEHSILPKRSTHASAQLVKNIQDNLTI